MEHFEHQCYYQDCDKRFKTKYNLRRHINSNHLLIKEFTCQVCSRMFASKQNLQGHEKSHFQYKKIPGLEIPAEVKNRNRTGLIEIIELKLSRIYKDTKEIAAQESLQNLSKPILPLVCHERTNFENHFKLPIIPVLLKFN